MGTASKSLSKQMRNPASSSSRTGVQPPKQCIQNLRGCESNSSLCIHPQFSLTCLQGYKRPSHDAGSQYHPARYRRCPTDQAWLMLTKNQAFEGRLSLGCRVRLLQSTHRFDLLRLRSVLSDAFVHTCTSTFKKQAP